MCSNEVVFTVIVQKAEESSLGMFSGCIQLKSNLAQQLDGSDFNSETSLIHLTNLKRQCFHLSLYYTQQSSSVQDKEAGCRRKVKL